MEINKIDEFARKSLQNKTLQPSSSAWERLSTQLDEAQKIQRKKKVAYWSYAASIALLISVVYLITTNTTKTPIVPNKLVILPAIDTTNFVNPRFNNAVPLEKAIVKSGSNKLKEQTVSVKRIAVKLVDLDEKTSIKNNAQTDNQFIVTTSKPIITVPDFVKKNPNSRIQVNSDDLLYAVTHTPKEVQEYYVKYQLNRDNVLKNIRIELQKNNLKIDANSLLTEVEKTIDEETFKKSFMQVIKGKISGFATAFSNRNN